MSADSNGPDDPIRTVSSEPRGEPDRGDDPRHYRPLPPRQVLPPPHGSYGASTPRSGWAPPQTSQPQQPAQQPQQQPAQQPSPQVQQPLQQPSWQTPPRQQPYRTPTGAHHPNYPSAPPYAGQGGPAGLAGPPPYQGPPAQVGYPQQPGQLPGPLQDRGPGLYGQVVYPPYGARPTYGYPTPQWGYAGWGPPPRRRRSPVAALLLGLIGLAAAGFLVLVIVGAATSETGQAGGAVSDETSVDHSPARAENPGSTPVDSADSNGVVARNTLYTQGGLDNGNCPAKNLGDATLDEQKAFYTALMDCLNDEWRPKVEGAGYPYQEPGLVVFDTPVDTPCGNASPEDGRTLAFYCPGDSVMYADVPQMRKFFDNIDVAYAIVIGHEFGHHVQQEVGILQAYDDLTYDNFDNRLELNRRVELQASCMGGLFLGAVAESFPMDDERLQRLQQVAGSFGDEPGANDDKRDHGSGVSNREWIFGGYTDNDTQVCDTFDAPADQVD